MKKTQNEENATGARAGSRHQIEFEFTDIFPLAWIENMRLFVSIFTTPPDAYISHILTRYISTVFVRLFPFC